MVAGAKNYTEKKRIATRNIAVFKALLAGSLKKQVSDEFNLALHYVTQIYSDVIQRLAVEVERTNCTQFPYKRELFSYPHERPPGHTTQWLNWTLLTIPRVRKHADYWLKLLETTDFN